MATYKVLQDIEAEDKLIGPLTLRQFIYGLVAALNGYLTFLVISKGAAFMSVVFAPITIVCLFFAWPWSRDQPTEVWALAKVRFMVKPRRRIWNQSGVKELVTITAPKRIETVYTNGLSQNEVQSRLRALADTIDSRGWAVKNVNVNMYGQASVLTNSDRLVSPGSLPQQVSSIDVRASDDILDTRNNPVAQQFDSMIAASAKAHRQQVIERLQAPVAAPAPAPVAAQQAGQAGAATNNYWFLNEPNQAAASVPQDAVTFNTQVITPGASSSEQPVVAAAPTPDEEEFIKQHKPEPLFSPNMRGHLHVIQPLSAQAGTQQAAQPSAPAATPAAVPADTSAPDAVTRKPDAAILDLVRNNDLNVATIAREIHKRKDPPQDEVVISLH